MRPRAALLSHVQQTKRPYNVPEIGQHLADTANRQGVAERFPALAVQQSLEVERAWLGHSARLLPALALAIVTTATEHKAQVFDRRRSRPGVGNLLALARRYDLHDLHRCPRGQECVAYGRSVNGAKASAGKRHGTAGSKTGNASLQWAVSEAAVRFWRAHPAGQTSRARLQKTQGQGQA